LVLGKESFSKNFKILSNFSINNIKSLKHLVFNANYVQFN